MFKLGLVLLVLVPCLGWSHAGRTVSSHISQADRDRFHAIFEEGIKGRDLQANYYASLHHSKLTAAESKATCSRLADLYAESKLNDFEKNYYFIGTFRQLKCEGQVPAQVDKSIRGSLDREYNTVHEIYFISMALKMLTAAPLAEDVKSKVAKNLQIILKKDDSLNNLGYSFNIAVELGATHGQAIANRIEDAIAQADEVDGKMLQFEGGLSTTALILSGALKLTKSLNKPSPITAEQAVKFSTYLISRRSVQTAKGVSVLLDVLSTVAEQTAVAPICVQVIGNGQLVPESPVISLKVVDLLGRAITPAIATVKGSVAAKKTPAQAIVADQAFVAKSSDKTVYSMDLAAQKLEPGMYVVDVAAGPTYTQKLEIKILGRVKVKSFEVGVGMADSAAAFKMDPVAFPKRMEAPLAADTHQKIVMKMALVEEASGKPLLVHQAFVRFEHKDTKEEIIFIAEADTAKIYRFSLDLSVRGADFGQKSGTYAVEVFVGDSSISNSFKWSLTDITLKFPAKQQAEEKPCTLRKPKPEIKHMFREPEKRPPLVVSNLFTALCFAPLLILIGVWMKMKVNIGNFPFSLSALGFHGGLGAILFLFYVFWVRLNMFDTIRYLLPLALFTFVCGNRLLRSIANRKADK